MHPTQSPERIPDRLKTSINFKVLGLILAGAIIFQVLLFLDQGIGVVEEAQPFIAMATPLLVACAALLIALRYGLSEVFGKSYLVYGLANLSVFLAEFIYYAYDVIYEIDPYPSVADIFFFAVYPLIIFHIILNFRFFKTKITSKQKAILIAIPLIITLIYSNYSLQEFGEANFDFYYGLIFVAGASVTLSLAAFGALVFRGGVLGTVWALLLFGVLVFTIADVWYYYLEVVGEYHLLHPVNLFWYISDWIVIYALYKHSKAI